MKVIFIASFLLLIPLTVVASKHTFANLVQSVVDYINLATPIVIGLAVLGFFWGTFRYSFSADEDKIKEARTMMLWGIAILFVMVSIWGILKILVQTFFP